MHSQTIAVLVRSHKQILRCDAHLADIHRRLEATSGVVAKALKIIKACDAEAASPGPETITPHARHRSGDHQETAGIDQTVNRRAKS
jgi:hypothetical protein